MEDEPSVGVVAFSFGQRADEPSPSNMALARAAMRAAQSTGGRVELVAQWEVARGLEKLGVSPDVVVGPLPDGQYLDTEDVWQVARRRFASDGVDSVISIAQPFLHLSKVRRLARRDGLHVSKVDVGPIYFDDTGANKQPWTRTRLSLLRYTLAQVIFGRKGH